MAEGENVSRSPKTLKSLIYGCLEELDDPETISKGSEAVCRVYEKLFINLRQWILSVGHKEDIDMVKKLTSEYRAIKRERIYRTIHSSNYETTYKYTIDRNRNTLQEATESTKDETVKDLLETVWENVKDKRASICFELLDIMKDLTDADEDVGSSSRSSRDII